MIRRVSLALVLLAVGSVSLAAALPALAPGSVPAPAEEAGAVRAATEAVMSQIDAFRRHDFDAAYTYASAEIHQIFDRQGFEQMVRGGYPEIASPRSASVNDSEVTPAGSVYLFVTIRGANGRTVDALYEMVREGNAWRVNGVVARPAAQTI